MWEQLSRSVLFRSIASSIPVASRRVAKRGGAADSRFKNVTLSCQVNGRCLRGAED